MMAVANPTVFLAGSARAAPAARRAAKVVRPAMPMRAVVKAEAGKKMERAVELSKVGFASAGVAAAQLMSTPEAMALQGGVGKDNVLPLIFNLLVVSLPVVFLITLYTQTVSSGDSTVEGESAFPESPWTKAEKGSAIDGKGNISQPGRKGAVGRSAAPGTKRVKN